ncbi:hypothetical protein SIID45300_01442 [Candidatus Magnetaquicoccaceae bacterium FCR-1]|uniref:Mannose-6-phosphate isomerase type II C-terminal domain-containing protein n=1 Tax=Candidatus Magnetaquiglobus chichijimensis TaxID=3141448 RepID=A0ABQ0C8A0_9PROT
MVSRKDLQPSPLRMQPVIRGDQTLLPNEKHSTRIPLGGRHRLTNPGAIPLAIIEVQSGNHLGEDDIVRLDDPRGRG